MNILDKTVAQLISEGAKVEVLLFDVESIDKGQEIIKNYTGERGEETYGYSYGSHYTTISYLSRRLNVVAFTYEVEFPPQTFSKRVEDDKK